MKTTLKKSLKLKIRTIRKLDVRSGLQGGRQGGNRNNDVTVVDCETFDCTYDCDTIMCTYSDFRKLCP